nr:glycosyltransferase family 2 protein [Pelosinus baikalensis]
MDKVGVVVLNYINYTDTIQCVNYLCAQSGVELEIVVVDNNSPNSSYEIITQAFSHQNIDIIINTENDGYAKGNNLGLRILCGRDVDWLLIVNPDTYFTDKYAIKNMIKQAVGLVDAGIIGPRVVKENGRTIMPYFNQPNLLNLLFEDYVRMLLYPVWYIVEKYIKRPFKVFRVHGCCMLGPTKVWQQAGFLDENTFLYWEETIFSYRVKLLGYKTYYVPNVELVHCHDIRLSDLSTTKLRFELESLNHFLLAYMRYGAFARKLVKLVRLTGYSIRSYAAFLVSRLLSNISIRKAQ